MASADRIPSCAVKRSRPLLCRPATDWRGPVRLRLTVPARAVTLAHFAAAHCRVPVDVAIATGIDAVKAAPEATVRDVLDRTVALKPTSEALPCGARQWMLQLRAGCSWHEDDLPFVWLPAEVLDDVSEDQIALGVQWAGETMLLRALLDLECAATRAGVSLQWALGSLHG